MKKILFAFILFFCFSYNVFAYENYNTQFNLDIPNYDSFLDSKICGSENVKDFIHSFIDSTDFSSKNWRVFIYLPPELNYNVVSFYLIPKVSSGSRDRVNFYIENYSYNNFRTDLFRHIANSTKTYYQYNLKLNTCDNDISTSQFWINFLSQLNGGSFSAVSSNIGDSNFYVGSYVPYNNYFQNLGNISITNNDNFDIIDNKNWIYFSSVQLNFNQDTCSSNSIYCKKLFINNNNTLYSKSDNIPTFYDIKDLFPNPTGPTFIGYETSLKTIYTNLDSSSFNNYNLSINFKLPNFNDLQDYVDNTSFNYLCSGRVDNIDYYSYESFNCSLSMSYSLDSINGTITFTFNNLLTSDNISNFDKIFVTIDSKYFDSTLNPTLYDFNYTYSLGNFYHTSYMGSIYESFSNLPLNFKLYLSSNNDLVNSQLFIKTFKFINYNIFYKGFSTSSHQINTIVGKSILADVTNEVLGIEPNDSNYFSVDVSNSIDTGFMIYQYNSSIPIPSLDLVFNSGIIISFNNSSSNDFYYIDNTGTITNGDFIPSYTSDDNNIFDISYYIGVVNSFIDGLSSDTLEVANITQSFYNSMPQFFQVFIFVVFILFCVYFTYLLIKR